MSSEDNYAPSDSFPPPASAPEAEPMADEMPPAMAEMSAEAAEADLGDADAGGSASGWPAPPPQDDVDAKEVDQQDLAT